MDALQNKAIETEVEVPVLFKICSSASYRDMMLICQIGLWNIFHLFEYTTSLLLIALQLDGFPYYEQEFSILSS